MGKGEFALGAAVLCTEGATGEAYGCAKEIGLVLESRRTNSRVFFPYNSRVYWVPNAELRRVKPIALEKRPRERRLVWLISELGAIEASIDKFAADSVVTSLYHGGLTGERFDQLRREMAGTLVSWTINPAGMSKIESVIEFR
ncbi:MAG: hypothetical protein HY292_06540 [Planctomycetes bacterium]|nr:hypothetical protein [Planctomycetota bacterium]